jgi:hypothetical protein
VWDSARLHAAPEFLLGRDQHRQVSGP